MFQEKNICVNRERVKQCGSGKFILAPKKKFRARIHNISSNWTPDSDYQKKFLHILPEEVSSVHRIPGFSETAATPTHISESFVTIFLVKTKKSIIILNQLDQI